MAYSQKEIEEIFDKVCERIENGEAVRTILKDKDMPDSVTFYKWVDNDKNKLKQYARACEARAEEMFEDILKIVDATEDDVIVDENGNFITNHNIIQRDRLRADARKWMLSKMMPKKYGDKLDMSLETTEIKPIITKRDE